MNPFLFGKIVRGEYFADRKKEIKSIENELLSGQNLVLISPRRYGKTSLVINAVEDIDINYLYIDMELVTGEDDLANLLIRKTLSLSRFEKFKDHLKKLRVQPDFRFNPESGEFSITMSPEKKDIPAYLEDALNLPERVAASHSMRLVIIFDEFQEVRRISPGLERKIRSIIQHHSQVVYLFIGSRQAMISDIFSNRKNPFYKFARQVSLDKIPEEEFKHFIRERFNGADVDTGGKEDDIINLTGNHPYYTQQLCHEIYNQDTDDKVSAEDIEKAIGEIIIQHDSDYMRWWNQADNTEKRILVGLSEGEQKLTSEDSLRKYGIAAASTASSALRRLIQKGFAVSSDRGVRIEDPFWEIWIRENRKQQI